MSTVEQLQSERDAAKLAALTSPIQAEIAALRDQIVAAKRRNETELVAELTKQRDELRAKRDAGVLELNQQVDAAKRAARAAAREADRKECESLDDDALAKQIAEANEAIAPARRRLKALTAEAARRQENLNVKRVISKLTPEQRKAALEELSR